MVGWVAFALAGVVPVEAAPGEVRAVMADRGKAPLPRRLGDLELAGAYVLHGASSDFGGISGARFADGRLLLLSDRSRLFELGWAAHAPKAPFAMPVLGERRLLDGRRRALDAEALELGPDGHVLVGDESRGRVFDYPPGASMPAGPPLSLPGAFAEHRPTNEGLETLARLPDGGVLAISEGAWAGTDLHAAVRLTDDDAVAFGYRSAPGFLPTDADIAGDRLFVLERRLSLLGGWQARIVTLPLSDLPEASGGSVDGEALATIGGSVLGENYEALAVRHVADSYVLLILSDDNFNGIQQTQMLELRWRP